MLSEKEEFALLAYLLEVSKAICEPAYKKTQTHPIRYARIDGVLYYYTETFQQTNISDRLQHTIGVNFESNYGAFISNSAMYTYKRGNFIYGSDISEWWKLLGNRRFHLIARPGGKRDFVDLTKYDKAQEAVNTYVSCAVERVKTIKVSVTPCPVTIELPAFEATYTHLVSKTLVSDLQAGIRQYLQDSCVTFQKEFGRKFIQNLVTEVCGVQILPEEMDHLFEVSETELGRSNFSIKVTLLCNILTQSRQAAEREVNCLLTSDNTDKQQIGKIIFRLLNALPDNAKKFTT